MSERDQLKKIRKVVFEDWGHIESVTEEEKDRLSPGKIRECFHTSGETTNDK